MFVSVNIIGPRPRSGGGRKLAEIFDGRGRGKGEVGSLRDSGRQVGYYWKTARVKR